MNKMCKISIFSSLLIALFLSTGVYAQSTISGEDRRGIDLSLKKANIYSDYSSFIASEELSGEIFTQPHAREKQNEVKIKESKFALHATQTDFLGAILISTKILPQIRNPGVMVEVSAVW